MIQADKIYLGKLFTDLQNATARTQQSIHSTTEFEQALMDGFGFRDGRGEEVLLYSTKLNKLMIYAQTKGITFDELTQYAADYKKVTISEYFDLFSKVQIKEEVELFLTIN